MIVSSVLPLGTSQMETRIINLMHGATGRIVPATDLRKLNQPRRWKTMPVPFDYFHRSPTHSRTPAIQSRYCKLPPEAATEKPRNKPSQVPPEHAKARPIQRWPRIIRLQAIDQFHPADHVDHPNPSRQWRSECRRCDRVSSTRQSPGLQLRAR